MRGLFRAKSGSRPHCRASRGQIVEQCLGVFQVGGVEAFCEPAVDVGEHRARLVATAFNANSSLPEKADSLR
jgi:hypothetical protein